VRGRKGVRCLSKVQGKEGKEEIWGLIQIEHDRTECVDVDQSDSVLEMMVRRGINAVWRTGRQRDWEAQKGLGTRERRKFPLHYGGCVLRDSPIVPCQKCLDNATNCCLPALTPSPNPHTSISRSFCLRGQCGQRPWFYSRRFQKRNAILAVTHGEASDLRISGSWTSCPLPGLHG
jgi:hypothetical protein